MMYSIKVYIYIFIGCCLFFYCSCVRNTSRIDMARHHEALSESRSDDKSSISRHDQQEYNDGGAETCYIHFKNENGVTMVPITINGVNMEFIFDTGASDIVISTVEAAFLYKQGKLSEDDVLGKSQYQIADGSISEGMVINLRTVQIGNRILHNIRASVVDNMNAPLLLGQSALSNFGNITIDYNNQTIELKY
jgi:aspartyl protease family protein